MRYGAGFILAFLIGAGCRFFRIPVPAPPGIVGALLVISVTLGFVLMDYFLSHRP